MCEAHRQEAEAARSSRPADGATFLVSDMTCGHCAGVITSAMEQALPGVEFSIDLTKSHVTVAGDASLAAAAIRTAGYSPEQVVVRTAVGAT